MVKNLKRNNSGLSLVEIVVVIAIMAVLASGTLGVIYSSRNYKVKKAYEVIDATLSETRVQCLAKQGAWMKIENNGSTTVVSTSYGSPITLPESVIVKYSYVDSAGNTTSDVVLTSAKPLVFSYDRGAGRFLSLKSGITDNGDGTYSYTSFASPDVSCTWIKVESGSYQNKIELFPATGKHIKRD